MMFFGSREEPDLRTARAQLAEAVEHCWKRWRQDRDLLGSKQDQVLRQEIQRAQNALTAEDPEPDQALERLVAAHNRCFPTARHPGWRENGEVILVALAVAMAIRAFFLQPFKIPTGSMQPTLNGITAHAAQGYEQAWWYRWVALPIFGQNVIRVVARSDGEFDVTSVHALQLRILQLAGNTLNLLPREATAFRVGADTYIVPIEERVFNNDVLGRGRPDKQPLIEPGQPFKKGDVILHCVRQTGDFLFVDRFTYHFRKPQRSDVFVFDTVGLAVSSPGEFYIKRLAGTPGDTLRIKDPDLYVSDAKASEPGFRRVMSGRDGYRGYTTRAPGYGLKYLRSPEDRFTLEKGRYFALGDNSFFSQDSRFWGPVPYPNIVGRGFFVYWPFTRHFGRVE